MTKMRRGRVAFLLFAMGVFFVLFSISHVWAKSNDDSRIIFQEGEFSMGDSFCSEEQGNSDWCADEAPHTVRNKAFSIDKYEVTNGEYLECFAEGICDPAELHETRPKDFSGMNQPVVFVSWMNAQSFCKWRGGDLPTEAQWEHAAEGSHPGGAHFQQKYQSGSPVDVGGQRPNSNGIYDMMGNVYEWTRDWYGPYPVKDIALNPKGPSEGKDKVVRGGAWHSPSHYLRVADRVARTPEYKYSDVGFRCVYSLQ